MAPHSRSTKRLGQIEAGLAIAEHRLALQCLHVEQMRVAGRDARESEELMHDLGGLIAVYRNVRAEILARL